MSTRFLPLQGIRILSLALNVPGPAALYRCRALGASCTKLEAPPPPGKRTGDPMDIYSPQAYDELHDGLETVHANLKTEEGQAILHSLLAQSQVLLTSFRLSATRKLGLDWESLHPRYPNLSLVRIVGAPGERADEAGHDLTYQAEAGLLNSLSMPTSLYADMSGALMASEAILQTQLARLQGQGSQQIEVALSEGARWMAWPVRWHMVQPGSETGGAHVGYRLYPCADGRVALAALERHFALYLWRQIQNDPALDTPPDMHSPATAEAIAAFLRTRTRAELDTLAQRFDIPLYTLP
ncbi:Crotonobetainyl-CoA:carnitine CoA-transferase CaiB [Lampropedia hyalina DSM 16112]|uniref:Crotonobetainyl-CoA:carnitine CoA-transferase CaiB n=1 Tax=Lampropedia hyalina DSM 16112 TaxID=1122156 RepID=A0A1M4V9Y6_9BURK|nr:CoA transferase [Lampropedia hyalina]SHE65687.1 Crotonobetainyl-CoA:carnitine CoA-transferase CaiB [Lampropedia hyalina DSM 16112]